MDYTNIRSAQVLVGLLILFLVGCSGQQDQDTSDKYGPVITAYYDGWNAGSIDSLRQAVSDNFTFTHSVFGDEANQDVQAFGEFVTTLTTAFPDLKFEVLEETYAGDNVVVKWQANGTNQGFWTHFPPTNNQVSYTGVSVFQMDGSRIASEETFANYHRVLQEVGYIPFPSFELLPPIEWPDFSEPGPNFECMPTNPCEVECCEEYVQCLDAGGLGRVDLQCLVFVTFCKNSCP